jgi:hypothetical protein
MIGHDNFARLYIKTVFNAKNKAFISMWDLFVHLNVNYGNTT